MRTANDLQIGGNHYRKHGTFQVWDAIIHWGLGFLDGNVVKYIVRYRDKGGIEDLQKARHYLDKLIEVEHAKLHIGSGTTESGSNFAGAVNAIPVDDA